MTENSAQLVALVGSRLCHDLISPIGAIQNGLELLGMAQGGETSTELDLIRDSCDSAAARIRFFRVAFGSARSNQTLSRKEIVTTLDGITRGSRTQVDWRPEGDIRRERAQLAFLAILCCEAALPLGGTIQCEAAGDGLSVSATASRVRIDAGRWSFLSGGGDLAEMTPDRVQFALLSVLAQDRGLPLAATTGEAGIRIEIG